MMNDQMQSQMAEATRLTHAGRLAEATAAIQRILRGVLPTGLPVADPGGTDAPIEVEFRVIDDSSPSAETAMPGMAPGIGTPRRSVSARPAATPGVLSPGALRNPGGIRSAVGRMGTVTPAAMPSTAMTGGQFIDRVYNGTAGTRSYKLYIPGGYTGQALPLVIMLHGCTQTPVDFATGTRMNVLAEGEMFFVAYPEQVTLANGSKCWNWFQATDQYQGTGEPSLIAGITQQIINAYHVDASRVYVAGLSAGGAMAAIMAATYPNLYAAVGVHSGLACGAAQDLHSAFTAMKQGVPQNTRQLAEAIPMIVFHGDRDTTVATINTDHLLDQWLPATEKGSGTVSRSTGETTVERGKVARGHAYTRSIYHDASGRVLMEKWIVHQAGHAWSGGSPSGSYTDPKGPNASAEMMRFFNEHPRPR